MAPNDAPKLSTDKEVAEFKRALDYRLSLADDEALLIMLWALSALQSGRPELGLKHLDGVPPEAAVEGLTNALSIYPWELETLANELLRVPKNKNFRMFPTRDWRAAADLVRTLRHLENADYGSRRETIDIYTEMGRIGARQFEWQRGSFFDIPELYRSVFIYGQGRTAEFIRESVGVSVEDFTFMGFAIMAGFLSEPHIRPMGDASLLAELGLNTGRQKLVLERISRPISDLRAEARVKRKEDTEVAYRPSVLREHPCILAGIRNRRLYAPVPELVAQRVSSGLFYDAVKGGGEMRSDYGRRFEAYVHALMTNSLTDGHWEPEFQYKTRLGPHDSPDVMLMESDGIIRLVMECKAHRMRFEARFGGSPLDEAGYAEMVKGVFQIWRFNAHCRLNKTGRAVSPDAIGVVLTLDEWFTARSSVIEEVLSRAHTKADSANVQILPEDRRPVAFVSIADLEATLRSATLSSLMSAIEAAATTHRGWMFTSVHLEMSNRLDVGRPYPFNDALETLLPWYGRLREEETDFDYDTE